MKERKPPSLVVTLGICLSIGMLAVVIYQLNALEERVIVQNQQLRSLGESAERLAQDVSRLKGGAATAATPSDASDGCPTSGWLHPEVPNHLVASDYTGAPPGAVLDGLFTRGWPSGDPKGFNPMLVNEAELSNLVQNYVDVGLASRNKWTSPDKWAPQLACRAEITDDYKEYTFYLRRGVKWHAPNPVNFGDAKYAWLKGTHELTARDFVFTLDMLMNPQVENGFAKNYYVDLESWKAIDDYTLVLRWKKKTYASINASLALSPIPEFVYAFSETGERFPKETVGLRFNQHWFNNKGYVGAGPYRMMSYTPGQSIILERNEDFYGPKPAIKHVTYPIYSDPNQTVLRLKAGELDFMYLLPGQYREEFLQWQTRPKSEWPQNSPFLKGDVQCEVIPEQSFFFIGWNADKPLFKDVKVRTALSFAFRRDELIERVFAGLGQPTSGPFLPESGYLDPAIQPLPFDLERARQLLAEAGFSDTDSDGLVDKVIDGKKTPFEFTLLIYGNRPEYTALSNIYKDDLLKIGIKMKAESAEWSLMQKKMDEKQFDAFTGGWAMSWDNDPYQTWHSSQADVPKGSNRVGFRNPEADKLIETLRETFEPEQRKALYQGIHRIIHAEQPYTFFFRRKRPYCWSSNVKGVSFAKTRPEDDYSMWYSTRTR
jgi:peptide/nickel transport system substrate-binding protein